MAGRPGRQRVRQRLHRAARRRGARRQPRRARRAGQGRGRGRAHASPACATSRERSRSTTRRSASTPIARRPAWSGVSARDAAQTTLEATLGNINTPSVWIDANNGQSYYVVTSYDGAQVADIRRARRAARCASSKDGKPVLAGRLRQHPPRRSAPIAIERNQLAARGPRAHADRRARHRQRRRRARASAQAATRARATSTSASSARSS